MTNAEQPPSPPHPASPRWPIAIGVLSIVFGALSLLNVIPVAAKAGGFARAELRGNFTLLPEYLIASAFFGAVLSLALLVSGIQLVCRISGARVGHLAYAFPAALLVIVHGIVIIAMSYALTSPDDLDRVSVASLRALAIITTPIGLAYPVFLIVWFMRRKIREEMANWR